MTPTDVCNIALAEGMTRSLINGFPPIDTSPAAVSAGIFYTPKIQALLRGAHWDFARRQQTLTLYRAAIINGQVSSNPPPQPWQFEYLYPGDCQKARFLLQYMQPQPSGTPLTTVPTNAIQPALANTSVPFVISSSVDSFNIVRKTILTNMPNAMLVYTMDLSQQPDYWDSLFLTAATATLAAFFIANLAGDKGLLQMQVTIARDAVAQARATNGNEQQTIQDHIPDWIQARAQGSNWGWNGTGTTGTCFYGWDSVGLPGGLFF